MPATGQVTRSVFHPPFVLLCATLAFVLLSAPTITIAIASLRFDPGLAMAHKTTMYGYAAIPEESLFGARDDGDGGGEYSLDLGSGAGDSACPTPQLRCSSSDLRRPIPRRPKAAAKPKTSLREKDAERDCGICFERAVAPVRTRCCSHLFCAEHIAAWLHGPHTDGRCPACRAPVPAAAALLALGHPALLRPAPRAPPPSRAPSPPPSLAAPSAYPAAYAAYPSVPSPCAPPSPASSPPASAYPTSEEEEEDATDFSLPALLRARALQTRRHAPHPLSAVLGVRGALVRLARAGALLGVVALLAARGRWAAEA
ncbi:hypothetical protein B0H15DRAFT_801126 [Mycena belliarum]|uniref:RING-type domain-containing protein n=1 Tax=Mycena belliarum TaxID=1033014 RepID=A0AAD6U886_9AGAR|nr:hypothetical protein B0H15DRAFT_801126 [Mycena belliae]